MYRFVKDNNSQGGVGKRLFVQGTSGESNGPQRVLGPPIVTHFSNPDEIDNLHAVYTKKRLSTQVLGSTFESTKTSQCGEDGHRRITTKIVRKLTTLTRGEEKSTSEDLLDRALQKTIQSVEDVSAKLAVSKAKRAKVRENNHVCVWNYLRACVNIWTHFYGTNIWEVFEFWVECVVFGEMRSNLGFHKFIFYYCLQIQHNRY